jgi:hypothetical protein
MVPLLKYFKLQRQLLSHHSVLQSVLPQFLISPQSVPALAVLDWEGVVSTLVAGTVVWSMQKHFYRDCMGKYKKTRGSLLSDAADDAQECNCIFSALTVTFWH